MSKGRRDIIHMSHNQYSKNLLHNIKGKDSPGPGIYEDLVSYNMWN